MGRFNLIPPGKALPYNTTEKKSKIGGAFLVFLSVVIIGVSCAIFVVLLSRDQVSSSLLIPVVFFVVGAGVLLCGLWMLTAVKEWTFTDESVSLQSRSLFGRKGWNEALSTYRGILSKYKYPSGDGASYSVYELTLAHRSDKSKSVQVYRSEDRHGATDAQMKEYRWEQERYARLFNLPTLENTAEGIVERRPEDLDKSLRQLVKEGVTKVEFDPSAPPPGRKLTVKVDGRFLRIYRWGWPLPLMVIGVMAILGGAGMIGAWLSGALGASRSLALIGSFVFVPACAFCIGPYVLTWELSVSPEKITVEWLSRWGRFGGYGVDAADVEEVVIKTSATVQGSRAVHGEDMRLRRVEISGAKVVKLPKRTRLQLREGSQGEEDGQSKN